MFHIGDSPVNNTLDHYLTSCVTRDQEEVYVARFPWKPDHPNFLINLTVAKQGTYQLYKHLSKTLDLLMTYHKARGFIEHVDDQSAPHFGVN